MTPHFINEKVKEEKRSARTYNKSEIVRRCLEIALSQIETEISEINARPSSLEKEKDSAERQAVQDAFEEHRKVDGEPSYSTLPPHLQRPVKVTVR